MLSAVYAFIGAAALGVVGWAYGIDPKIERLNDKVDSEVKLIDQKYESLEELINARFDSLEKFTEHRLGRIERALNGHLRG